MVLAGQEHVCQSDSLSPADAESIESHNVVTHARDANSEPFSFWPFNPVLIQ